MRFDRHGDLPCSIIRIGQDYANSQSQHTYSLMVHLHLYLPIQRQFFPFLASHHVKYPFAPQKKNHTLIHPPCTPSRPADPVPPATTHAKKVGTLFLSSTRIYDIVYCLMSLRIGLCMGIWTHHVSMTPISNLSIPQGALFPHTLVSALITLSTCARLC